MHQKKVLFILCFFFVLAALSAATVTAQNRNTFPYGGEENCQVVGVDSVTGHYFPYYCNENSSVCDECNRLSHGKFEGDFNKCDFSSSLFGDQDDYNSCVGCNGVLQAEGMGYGQNKCELACGAQKECDEYGVGEKGLCNEGNVCNENCQCELSTAYATKDEDFDGVPDEADKCQGSDPFSEVLSNGCPVPHLMAIPSLSSKASNEGDSCSPRPGDSCGEGMTCSKAEKSSKGIKIKEEFHCCNLDRQWDIDAGECKPATSRYAISRPLFKNAQKGSNGVLYSGSEPVICSADMKTGADAPVGYTHSWRKDFYLAFDSGREAIELPYDMKTCVRTSNPPIWSTRNDEHCEFAVDSKVLKGLKDGEKMYCGVKLTNHEGSQDGVLLYSVYNYALSDPLIFGTQKENPLNGCSGSSSCADESPPSSNVGVLVSVQPTIPFLKKKLISKNSGLQEHSELLLKLNQKVDLNSFKAVDYTFGAVDKADTGNFRLRVIDSSGEAPKLTLIDANILDEAVDSNGFFNKKLRLTIRFLNAKFGEKYFLLVQEKIGEDYVTKYYDSFEFVDLDAASNECRIISGNDDAKFKIYILGEGYDSKEEFLNQANLARDAILSFEPFKSNPDKFQFLYNSFVSSDDYFTTKLLFDKCSHTHTVILTNRAGDIGAIFTALGKSDFDKKEATIFMGSMKKSKGYNDFEIKEVMIHEFGHIFGMLQDEYGFSLSSNGQKIQNPFVNEGAPNCAPDKATAQKWWSDLEGIDSSNSKLAIGYYYNQCYGMDKIIGTRVSIMMAPSPNTEEEFQSMGFGAINERCLLKVMDVGGICTSSEVRPYTERVRSKRYALG